MLSCMTFVFCSLLELAWVGYLCRDLSTGGGPQPPKPPPTDNGSDSITAETPINNSVGTQVNNTNLPRKRRSHNATAPAPWGDASSPGAFKMTSLQRKSRQPGYGSLAPPPFMAVRDNDYEYRPPGFGLDSSARTPLLRHAHNKLNHVQPQRQNSQNCNCTCQGESEMKSNFHHHDCEQNVTPVRTAKLTKSAKVAAVSSKKTVIDTRVSNEMFARKIDKISAILFPSLFVLFNICYWSIYLQTDESPQQ